MFMNKVLKYAAVRWAVSKASVPYDYCKISSPCFKTSAEKAEGYAAQVVDRLSAIPAVKAIDERAAGALDAAEDRAAVALAAAESFVAQRRAQLEAIASSVDERLGSSVDHALTLAEAYVPPATRPYVDTVSRGAEAAVEALLPVERVSVVRSDKPVGAVAVLSYHIPAFHALRRRTAGKCPVEVAKEVCASSKSIASVAARVATDKATLLIHRVAAQAINVLVYALALPLVPVIFGMRLLGIKTPACFSGCGSCHAHTEAPAAPISIPVPAPAGAPAKPLKSD